MLCATWCPSRIGWYGQGLQAGSGLGAYWQVDCTAATAMPRFFLSAAASPPPGYVRLWDGGANSDPWTFTEDTGVLLDAFGDYWNKNMQAR